VRRVFAVLGGVSRHWLRSREAVFFSLVFPVVLLLIFSSVFAGGGAAEFTVYVQNNDVDDGQPTELSATLVESLEASDVIDVRRIEAGRDVEEWAAAADTEGSTRILVIHDGFADRASAMGQRARTNVTRRTVAGLGPALNDSSRAAIDAALTAQQGGSGGSQPARLTFLTAPDDSSAAAVRGILQQYVASFNDRVTGVTDSPATVESGSVGDERLRAVDYFLPALVAAVIMINTVITLPTMVSRFGDDGTLKRLAATPLRRWEWLAAHLIVQLALSLVVTALMLLVGRLVFDVTVLPGPIAILLLLVGTLGFASLGLTIGGILSDPDAASTVGNVIAFPVLFLSGTFWQLELMPQFLQTVGTALPLYHLHHGLRQLMVVGTTEGVPLAFAMLGGLAVVFLATAIRTTRWRDF